MRGSEEKSKILFVAVILECLYRDLALSIT